MGCISIGYSIRFGGNTMVEYRIFGMGMVCRFFGDGIGGIWCRCTVLTGGEIMSSAWVRCLYWRLGGIVGIGYAEGHPHLYGGH